MSQKNDPISLLIQDYKVRISTTLLKDEIYKWELVDQYRGRPNTEATDFYQEIKDIKFNNLIYGLSIAVIRHIARDNPEDLRQAFIKLYDESKGVTERINLFSEESLKIYRGLGETLSHHQDERTIATYLTFHNPDKYTFYKSSYYKKYCKLLGIKVAKKNEKVAHYLSLIDELIEKYIKPDTELIEQVKLLIPEFYDGVNHKLLAQDILFQMLDNKEETSYWIFQGNPNLFDFETALRDKLISSWTVSAHKSKIQVGDKVIIWITGNKSGCYALAEVTSEPHEKTSSPDEHLWKTEDKNDLKANLKITHNLVENPILKINIDPVKELNNLKVGNQGTNFSATKEEYEKLLELIMNRKQKKYWLYAPGENASKWEEFYNNGIMGLGWDEIGDLNLLGDSDDITKIIQTTYKTKSKSYNNALANIEFREVISVGDIIITKKGRQEYLGYGIVTSDYYYDKTRESYQKCRKVDWKKKGNWNEPKDDIVIKTLTDITKYPDYVNRLIDLIGIEKDEQKINTGYATMNLPLNTILYGPPGTGKTYILNNEYVKLFTSSESSITKQDFLKDIIQNCSWWQVIALAVLELGKTKVADIFKHEYVQIKAQISNSTTVTPTIWGQLQSHTIEECENVKVQRRMPPFIFNKTNKSEWEILENEVEEQSPELLELKSKIDNFDNISHIKIKRFEFITFHQSYSYEDFIEGIKPELSESDIAYSIQPGVFQELCNRARNDLSNKYAIFIDEINRGNISSIFGELITLIEEDKREGMNNEIKATLPYSKKPFSVPSNLYIIGTMNTADRSVEALDTALRRRFSFIEMNPKPEILDEDEFKCNGIDLKEMLIAINGRIEKLLDKDYCIGHSYFLTIKDRANPEDELRAIFQNKILPLLQEYFYGDWGKIQLILGEKFVEVKKDTVTFLKTDRDEDFEEYEGKLIYNFSDSKNWSLDTFKSIYE